MKRKKNKLSGKKRTKKNSVIDRALLRKLLQNINASVMITDSRGRIVFANKKYTDFFRSSGKDIIGKCWISSIIPGSKSEAVRKIFNNIKSKKTISRFDTPVLPGRGHEKCFRWTGVPLKEKRSSFYMFVGKEANGHGRAVRVYASTPRMLNKMYMEVVEALFAASEISEPGTAKHAIRVMLFAVALARKLRISKRRIKTLEVACLLHDLGKLAIDEDILFKKGKLNKKEFAQIKKHPHWGSEIISLVYFLRDIIPVMSNHHENYNGSGYPAGVKGKNIPLEARILSVADIYEALTADRPYRKGFSSREAIAIMEAEKGKKLDPELTDIFLDMVKKGKFGGGDY